MSEKRYDAVFIWEYLPFVDYHYCGDSPVSIAEDVGRCMNLEHGSTFEEAKREVIEYLKARIEEWETMTEEDFECDL